MLTQWPAPAGTADALVPETGDGAARPITVRRRDPRQDRVRVLIADPDALSRRLVRQNLAAADGIVVIGEVRTGVELIELTRHYTPEVVLMEIGQPDLDGVDVVRRLGEASPATAVVVLATHASPELALQVLRAGAAGFFPKDRDPSALPRVARKVAAGEAIVPRELTTVLVAALRRVPERGYRPIHSQLTTREWEIVDLIADGVTTPAIADRLFVSQATVYSHIKSILRKLGVHSRSEAVAAAALLRPAELGIPASRA